MSSEDSGLLKGSFVIYAGEENGGKSVNQWG